MVESAAEVLFWEGEIVGANGQNLDLACRERSMS